MTSRWAPLSFLSPSHVLPLSHHLHGVAAATDLGSLWDSTSSRLLVPTSASLPGRLLVVPYVVPHRVLPTLQTSRAAQVGASPGLPHPPVLATPTELLQGERAQLWPACPLPTEMRLSGAKGSLHFQLETLTKGYPSVTPTCIPTVPPDRHIAQGGHSTGASRFYCGLCADSHTSPRASPLLSLSVQGQRSCNHPTSPKQHMVSFTTMYPHTYEGVQQV